MVVLVLGIGGTLGVAQWRQAAPPVAAATDRTDNPGTARGNPGVPEAWRNDPRVRAYRDRLAFQRDARLFARQAAGLDPAERARRAGRLASAIDHYERAGELSAGETLMLRIGLIRADDGDEATQVRRITDLVERYRAHARARNAAFLQAQRNDPAFNDYKHREARIVREVMAMTRIPGGLPRDTYLRQRLQQERQLAYADTH
ncbi:hypothetical protein EER27_04205 [Lysobacter psychrotolerans]|uniref:Uncharacterized protein n=1 Tax=Montanilutibacter psychrotolerans TaxID=1327343 RepID=A0A3M8SUJ7_9GAMM|nr:hypothetical protein EER27_04205 [Lysobacter psychrotolerans]